MSNIPSFHHKTCYWRFFLSHSSKPPKHHLGPNYRNQFVLELHREPNKRAQKIFFYSRMFRKLFDVPGRQYQEKLIKK